MRILHVSQYCHARSIGGTERYMLDLIRGVEAAGSRNAVIWLRPGHNAEQLEADGVAIFTLPSPQARVDAPLSGFNAAAEKLLERERPNWLHFHTFGLTEAALAELGRRRGIRIAFTFHSPGWFCRRGTMLLHGLAPCDGAVRGWRCSACQLEERLGRFAPAAPIITAASAGLGWAGFALGRSSLRRRSAFFYDTARFGRSIRQFLALCDLVVSCAGWSGPVLRRNGARADAIVHCPQGVSPEFVTQLGKPVHAHGDPNTFTVGYVGRVTQEKGVDVLLKGFSTITDPHARLRIVGWPRKSDVGGYLATTRNIADRDPRIELVPKTALADTVAEYQKLDLLAIPSVWLETGPLTLFEAIAAGVPVYGTDRIGQLDLLRRHGKVISENTPAAWRDALDKAIRRHREGTSPGPAPRGLASLRSMTDVAKEMLCYYTRHNSRNGPEALV